MMRVFQVYQDGTGLIGEGVEYSDDTCAVRSTVPFPSTAIYRSVDEFTAADDNVIRVVYVGGSS